MPVMTCKLDGKPGWKFGGEGHCYTYTAGDEASSMAAKKKAIAQGLAMGEIGDDLEDPMATKVETVVKALKGEVPVAEAAEKLTEMAGCYCGCACCGGTMCRCKCGCCAGPCCPTAGCTCTCPCCLSHQGCATYCDCACPCCSGDCCVADSCACSCGCCGEMDSMSAS